MDPNDSERSAQSGPTIELKGEIVQPGTNDDELQNVELRNRPDAPKKSLKFKVTIFILCLVSSIVAMDSVIVAACLPAIAVSLKGGSLEVFWVGTSYLLAQTVSCIFISELARNYAEQDRSLYRCMARSRTFCE